MWSSFIVDFDQDGHQLKSFLRSRDCEKGLLGGIVDRSNADMRTKTPEVAPVTRASQKTVTGTREAYGNAWYLNLFFYYQITKSNLGRNVFI